LYPSWKEGWVGQGLPEDKKVEWASVVGRRMERGKRTRGGARAVVCDAPRSPVCTHILAGAPPWVGGRV
jgi:hypothetical protein